MDVDELAKALRNLTAYDISPVFDTNMPGWPSHPTMGIIRDARNYEQNGYFAQTLVMSEHTGSHVDAPAHNHPTMADATIETYPVSYLLGPYKKYDLSDLQLGPGDTVGLEALHHVEARDGFRVEADDVVLIQYGWDAHYHADASHTGRRWWGSNEPGLSEEACRYFADAHVRAVGSDTAACDIAEVDGQVKAAHGHSKYFLPNHILIIEGLQNLGNAPPTGLFIALPLKIRGGSGSPIRPMLLA